MNLFELQERLKDFSQDQLVREMQAPTGTAPQYLVLSELQRRQRMMREQQAQTPQDQTTVAQDAVAAAGVPQGGLADMARAMAPRTDMDMNTAVQPVERMQAGGMIGDPLAPYAQHLNQTYTAPKIESFVENVRNMEQQTFAQQPFGMQRTASMPLPFGQPPTQAGALARQQPAPPLTLNAADPYDGMRGFGVMMDNPLQVQQPQYGVSRNISGGQGFVPMQPQTGSMQQIGSPFGIGSIFAARRMADGGVVRMQPGGEVEGPNTAALRAIIEAQNTVRGMRARNRAMQAMLNRANQTAGLAGIEPRVIPVMDEFSGLPPEMTEPGTLAAIEPQIDTSGAYADLLGAPTRAEAMFGDIGSLQGPMQPEPYAPVRQAAPLSARPDILMDLVPEPEVTPFQFGLGGGGGGRRGGAPSAGYTEEDLANVSPGRGGTQPVVGAPSIVELLSEPDSEGDPRSRRSRAATDAREAAAAEADAIRAAEAARMMEINEIPAVARRVSDDGEVIPPPVVTPPEAGEDVNSVVRGGGNREAAPAADDAFQQDKWLALAQFGLNLMSSQQPTFGGAIGEAGLAGITALRQARGERDERVAAQQARADRMAASAARPETDGISSTERAAYFRAANEAEAEAARLELAIARGGEVGEGGFVMNPYTEEELAILQRQLNAARSRVSVYSGLSNPSLATIQAAL
jgi:hypothetical protein